MRTLKHKIANPLFIVPISIEVGAMQVEHLLEVLHLPEEERREPQAEQQGSTRLLKSVGHA